MRELQTGTYIHTTVTAVDEPSFGGACHEYKILKTHIKMGDAVGAENLCNINFQQGPVKEHGVNGIHEQDLICILIDRLEGFQQGEYPCMENKLALVYLYGALGRLKDLAERRKAAGVEGTSQKDPMCGDAQEKAKKQHPTPTAGECGDCEHQMTVDNCSFCPLDECDFKQKTEKPESQ